MSDEITFVCERERERSPFFPLSLSKNICTTKGHFVNEFHSFSRAYYFRCMPSVYVSIIVFGNNNNQKKKT